MKNPDNPAISASLFFQETTVAMCTFTTDYRLDTFNAAAGSLFSITENDLGKHAEKLVRVFNKGVERTANEELDTRQRASSGETISGRYEILRADGSVRFVEANVSPIYSEGTLQGFAALFQDVTASVYQSAVEQDKDDDLHLLYELSGITTHGIFILDKNHTVKFWNRGAESLFDLEPLQARDVLQGKPLPVFFSEAESSMMLTGKDFTKDVEWKAARHYRFQFRRRQSHDTSYIVTCYDITEKIDQERIHISNTEHFDRKLKEKENAIFLAHQRLQYHVNNTPLGIVEWEKKVVISWSKKAEEIFGWTADETVGKTAEEFNLISGNDPELLKFRERVFNQHSTSEHNIVCNRHKDGHDIYCEWYSSVLRDEKGSVVSVLTFVEDITPRILAAQKLQYQKQQLSTIFNATGDVLFMLDVQPGDKFPFSAVNHKFLELTGLKEQDVIGMDAIQFHPPHLRDSVLQNHRSVIANKRSLTWEGTTPFPSGKRTGIITLTPVFDEDGACTHLVGSVHDVTERKKLEAEILKMQAIVQSSPNYISIIRSDEAHSYDFINAAGRELLGIKQESIEGMTVTKALGQTETERLYDIATKTEGAFSEQTYLRNQDTGEKIPMLLNCFRLEMEDEQAFACIGSDLRELNNARHNLESANIKLKELTEHLQRVRDGERIAIGREIHDELGQLLTATKIDVHQALQQFEKNPPAAMRKLDDALLLLDTSIGSIRSIVSHLRPDLLEDLGLVAALRLHIEQFSSKTGVATQFICTQDHINASPETALSLFRICQEALTNIQRYASASNVIITLKETESAVLLSIKDDGRGFDPDSVSAKKSFGILGMSERALLCGGNMQLTSAVGNGTSITITIPMQYHEQHS